MLYFELLKRSTKMLYPYVLFCLNKKAATRNCYETEIQFSVIKPRLSAHALFIRRETKHYSLLPYWTKLVRSLWFCLVIAVSLHCKYCKLCFWKASKLCFWKAVRSLLQEFKSFGFLHYSKHDEIRSIVNNPTRNIRPHQKKD